MTMGFKYQMLACSYPQELLHVTLNHLYQLRAKVEQAKKKRMAMRVAFLVGLLFIAYWMPNFSL